MGPVIYSTSIAWITIVCTTMKGVGHVFNGDLAVKAFATTGIQTRDLPT